MSRIEALARQGGGDFERGYLDCVAEAAQRGARELDRLRARLNAALARPLSNSAAAGIAGRLCWPGFMEAFVDGLDLATAGFARVQAKETGRPGYAPGDLLKLYIYGYLNRIRSSRRLEAETHRNSR